MSQVDTWNSFAGKRARTDGGRREGDWTCPSCGNVNFSFRTTCNMPDCTQSRPADHNVGPPPFTSGAGYPGSAIPSSVFGGAPYGSSYYNGSPLPPYDLPAEGSSYPYGYGGSISVGSPYGPLHMSGSPPYSGGLYGMPPLMDRYGIGPHMGHGPMGLSRPVAYSDDDFQKKPAGRDNDWICPNCGNRNFAFRNICNTRKCNTARPVNQDAKSENLKGSKPKMPEGSWKCDKCSNINYLTRCNRQNCGAERPEGNEARGVTSDEDEQSSQQEAIKQREEFRREVGCLKIELQQVRVDRDQQAEHVQCMAVELKKHEELNGKYNRDIALTKTSTLEETCSSQQDQIKSLQYQLAVANEKLKVVSELQSHVIDLECQLVEAEKLRKKLHNAILELKGNIRVFCRVRPVLPDPDCRGADGIVVSYPTGVEYLGRGIDLMHNSQNHSFTFDKVFDHEASQLDVFFEISELVQSALDGHKVCIFAYGQTGSGKTYTMMGKPEADEQKGLIPRSLEQIFETSEALKYEGWKYKMQASMLEIYNEAIRDLLSPSRHSSVDAINVNKQYTIKHDSAGNTFVSDLTVVDVCSINEVSILLNQSAQSRSVGKTQMNEQSSRSHFVFTLRISGMNDATEQQVEGVLNLIDLAGSERLAKSGSTGDLLKETQAINKSLPYLSDVIFAIGKEKDYVPSRNSKLTYLLQPYLGGDSKTLMFVNISPEASSANESLCSLRFAARVAACKVEVPRVGACKMVHRRHTMSPR